MLTGLRIRGRTITGSLSGRILFCSFHPEPRWFEPAPGEYCLQAPFRDPVFGVTALVIPASLLGGRGGGGLAAFPELTIGGLAGPELPVAHVAGWAHRYQFRPGEWARTDYDFLDHPERSEPSTPDVRFSGSVANRASAPRHRSVFVLSSRPVPRWNSLVVTFGFPDLVVALSKARWAGLTIC